MQLIISLINAHIMFYIIIGLHILADSCIYIVHLLSILLVLNLYHNHQTIIRFLCMYTKLIKEMSRFKPPSLN